MAQFYAVIVANPNSDDLGEIKSKHRTLYGAAKSLMKLDYPRWSYVAQRRADGSYPSRVEAETFQCEVMEACYDLQGDAALNRFQR